MKIFSYETYSYFKGGGFFKNTVNKFMKSSFSVLYTSSFDIQFFIFKLSVTGTIRELLNAKKYVFSTPHIQMNRFVTNGLTPPICIT